MPTRKHWRAGLHLLDHQILDCNGRMAGKVDDLELDTLDDGAPVVTALLSGAGALGPLVGGRIGRGMASLERRLAESDTPSRVGFALVESIDGSVTLTATHDELPTGRAERWVRDRIVDHIPGAAHAPE